MDSTKLDIVLPVHNEGESIEAVLSEFMAVLEKECPDVKVRLVICEDGSKDNTVAVLKSLADRLPIKLLTSTARKGYSQAVIEGLAATTADWVLCIDSDGQVDPSDFKRVWSKRAPDGLVIGYRNPRNDPWPRIVMSGAFHFVYRRLFDVRLKDPSCPFLLISRHSLSKIQRGNLGVLKQGFWWEFMARAKSCGTKIVEISVSHRPRHSGTTQVYRLNKIPGIAYRHLLGLFTLRSELKQASKNSRQEPSEKPDSLRRVG